jgi:hypothetical protein
MPMPASGSCGPREPDAGYASFLKYLRDRGISTTLPVTVSAADDSTLLSRYCEWMRLQRGTCDATLWRHRRYVREVLAQLGEMPSQWDAHGLRAFRHQSKPGGKVAAWSIRGGHPLDPPSIVERTPPILFVIRADALRRDRRAHSFATARARVLDVAVGDVVQLWRWSSLVACDCAQQTAELRDGNPVRQFRYSEIVLGANTHSRVHGQVGASWRVGLSLRTTNSRAMLSGNCLVSGGRSLRRRKRAPRFS